MHLLKFFILSLTLLFISCDDGDIIVTELDFDIEDLESCFNEGDPDSSTDDQTVFFNYNTETDEVIYLLINEEYDLTEDNSNDNNGNGLEGNIGDDIGGDGFVRSLRFSSSIDPNDFFCTSVATQANFDRELNASLGTYNIITTDIIDLNESEDGDADEDGDGVSNFRELFIDDNARNANLALINAEGFIDLEAIDDEDIRDTDGDGLPDFRDSDDDNDNVSTATELYPKDINDEDGDGDITDNIIDEDENGDPIFLNTDGDNTPDYLDTDDDNDGVLTILEFDNIGNSPTLNTNDDDLAAYLNPAINTRGVFEAGQEIVLLNNYDTLFETIVVILNTTLSDNDSNITLGGEYILGTFDESDNPQFQVIIQSDGSFRTIEIDPDDPDQERELDQIMLGTIDLGLGNNNETNEEIEPEEIITEETP